MEFGGLDNMLAYKIFLDRYAEKSDKTDLKVGDLVLCLTNPSDGVGSRELATITAINDEEPRITAELKTGFEIVNGERKSLIGKSQSFLTMFIEKPLEVTTAQMYERVAKHISDAHSSKNSRSILDLIEMKDITDDPKVYNSICNLYKNVMLDGSFVAAGRMLIGLGQHDKLSLFNCAVIPSPKDSRGGIDATLSVMTELMARGSGVGINLSSLRPRGAIVNGVNGRSSGAVSWGDEYSRRTGRVEQGGCVIGATLVRTPNGNIPIKDLVGTMPWIYTYNTNCKRIELKQALWVAKTGENKEIWELRTDKDLVLWATPDHKILMSNGEYVELRNLRKGAVLTNLHKVKSIQTLLVREDVYDLEVPDTHNFVIVQDKKSMVDSGLVIHNSRRGALLLMLNDWHPDLLEFIDAKRQSRNLKQALSLLSESERQTMKVPLENCNISIGISNKFMEAVTNDADWDLVFPDTTTKDYTTIWNGDLEKWITSGKEVQVYKTCKAREIWHAIMESAWESGEPGIVFLDRYNEVSNTNYYESGKIICTNPCGEQGLSAYGSCCLGHINLPKFLKNQTIEKKPSTWKVALSRLDLKKLEHSVRVGVRFLDSIYDIALFVSDEQRKAALGDRRIGLGTLGLAELLIRVGITYGDNKDCLKFLDRLYNTIQSIAYDESIKIAKEFGPFPNCDKEKHAELPMVTRLGLEDSVRKWGMRNATLTTQAPTGTVGTMLHTSTGIEPYPSLKWSQTTNIGEYSDQAIVLSDWKKQNPDTTKLPKFFVTSLGQKAIAPKDHAAVQIAIQEWTDSSISKTCNMPNNATIDDVCTFYESLYREGAKGGTIYRDGCRDRQVISSQENVPEKKLEKTHRTVAANVGRSAWITKITTPAGTVHVTISVLDDGPYEIFILVGKGGSELNAQCEALGRLASTLLQVESKVSPIERLMSLREQLRGIGGSEQVGFGPDKVRSVPDGLGKAIELFLQEYPDGKFKNGVKEKVDAVPSTPMIKVASVGHYDLCPGCGAPTLIHESGCVNCTCGFSRC